jgi:PhnB protein
MAEPAPAPISGIVPHITVDGAAAAIDFYVKAFGAEELARHPTPDGRLMHAALRINGGLLYMHDAFPEHGVNSPRTIGATAVTLHIEVADSDAAFARAVAAGATVAMPLADMFWGARYGQVIDPFGHLWSIASPTKPISEAASAAGKPISEAAIAAGARDKFG